jgi:diacylglycerol kinase (ATP)
MTSVQQVGILYNPRSGKREASSFASSISVYLHAKGLQVRSRESSRKYQDEDISGFLNASDVLIVVGGDGTFRELIPLVAAHGTPVVLFPAGNESLLAKKFGISRSIPDLYEKIIRFQVEEHFFGFCNSLPFFLMASIGLDSEVVRIVDTARTAGSSDFLYVQAFLKAVFRYRPAVFSLHVDENEELIQVNSGSFIVSNSSMYAGSFLPAGEASSLSEEFFVRVFNDSKAGMILNWMRSGISRSALSTVRASQWYLPRVSIRSAHPMPVQIDGDYAGDFTEIRFCKSEQKIRFVV